MSHEIFPNPVPETAISPELNGAFARDPFSALAQESHRLFAVHQDPTLSDAEKDQQLDSYFRTIESLDRQNFPETPVTSGVPAGYIPDGFTDLGVNSSLDPSQRFGRPMNYVDTYNTLLRHKAVFSAVFKGLNPADFAGVEGQLHYQQIIISNVAREIAMTMPATTGYVPQAEPGGLLPVSTVNTANCQQHALTAQVLLQAFGIRSRLSRNYFADPQQLSSMPNYPGDEHVSNVIIIPTDGGGREYMFDTTNPQPNQAGEWAMGLFRLDQQDSDGAWRVAGVNGRQRKYREHNLLDWMVRRLPEPVAISSPSDY